MMVCVFYISSLHLKGLIATNSEVSSRIQLLRGLKCLLKPSSHLRYLDDDAIEVTEVFVYFCAL